VYKAYLYILSRNAQLLLEKIGDVVALITLDLDDLTHVLIFHDGSIGTEIFLESLQDFLMIVRSGQALKGSQRLSAISLCLRGGMLEYVNPQLCQFSVISSTIKVRLRDACIPPPRGDMERKLTLNPKMNVALSLASIL